MKRINKADKKNPQHRKWLFLFYCSALQYTLIITWLSESDCILDPRLFCYVSAGIYFYTAFSDSVIISYPFPSYRFLIIPFPILQFPIIQFSIISFLIISLFSHHTISHNIDVPLYPFLSNLSSYILSSISVPMDSSPLLYTLCIPLT